MVDNPNQIKMTIGIPGPGRFGVCQRGHASSARKHKLTEQRGFTLVEMLIALVLSSIIFVSAYQVISNLVQYQVRAQVQNEQGLDRLLAINLISQIIEMGVNQYDLYYRPQKEFLFQGESDSVQIISRAYSGRFDRPGHRVYRVYHREGELYVSYRSYDRDYRSNQPIDLATGLKIEGISFEYFDTGNWTDEWRDDRSIPEFIRVSVAFPGHKSTEWTLASSRR